MTNAKTILDMIENVDPADTAKLDEIDARVWCYYRERFFHSIEFGSVHQIGYNFNIDRTKDPINLIFGYDNTFSKKSKLSMDFGFDRYTTSRNALKAIRPYGYSCSVSGNDYGGYFCSLCKKTECIGSKQLPTEELAELHAIIQAIAYERGEKL